MALRKRVRFVSLRMRVRSRLASILWDTTFSGCENRSHACHMNMWRMKDPLSVNLALVLSVKLNHDNILASVESLE
ncbi:hypothetical protein TNCV_1868521 [Trichonephila clavipes]|nr:hypothetical protein TNCV_1868521 [Trichonephila clavipes]